MDWEAHYQSGDTPWDKGAPHPALVDFLREENRAREAGAPLRGKILVPGCGAGHDVRALAAADASAEPLGIDIAPGAIARARAFPPAGRERYELADLFNLSPRFHEAFDAVWEHTCFCAIDPAMRPRYVEAIAAALKPGGHLLAVFYLDPGQDDDDAGPPFGVTVQELDALFSPRFQLLREWTPAHTYAGREGGELARLLQKKR